MSRPDESPVYHNPEFYDAFELYATRPDVAFFVDEARNSGGPVLELGCGTGRVLLPTARAGVETWGLDSSPAMLDRCRTKLRAEPPEVQDRVTLLGGDMRAFDVPRSFALVTLPFRPFQHLLEVDEQLACLQCIHRALTENGRVIVDVFNPNLAMLVDDSRLIEFQSGSPFQLPDGRQVTRRERIAGRNYARQVQEIELIYYIRHPEGWEERLVESFPMRYFFRYELEHLLARSAFHVEAEYGDYGRTPLDGNEPTELILVARKIGGRD